MDAHFATDVLTPLCYCNPEGVDVTANSVVRDRLDERIKNAATAVLSPKDLTISDAFLLMTVGIAKRRRAAVRAVGAQ
jgi:RelB antitoxin